MWVGSVTQLGKINTLAKKEEEEAGIEVPHTPKITPKNSLETLGMYFIFGNLPGWSFHTPGTNLTNPTHWGGLYSKGLFHPKRFHDPFGKPEDIPSHTSHSPF